MSHEDLIRTNKKQLIFLQKLKAKSDDLQAKLADFSEVCFHSTDLCMILDI